MAKTINKQLVKHFPPLFPGILWGNLCGCVSVSFSLLSTDAVYSMALLLFAAYNNAGKQFKQSAALACLYFSTCVSLKWLVVTPRGGPRKPWHELKLRPPAQLFKMKVCSRRPKSPTTLPTSLATCVTSSRPCYGDEMTEGKAGSHFNSVKGDFVAATKKKKNDLHWLSNCN